VLLEAGETELVIQIGEGLLRERLQWHWLCRISFGVARC